MGWLGRSLGQFGADWGSGKTIAQQWQDNQQKMRMAAADQSLKQLQASLEQQRLQYQISRQASQDEAGKWQWFTTKRADGGEDTHYYNPETQEDRIVNSGSAPPPKYTNFRTDDEGKLYGFNEASGKEEPIQGASGADFSKQTKAATERTPVVKTFNGDDWQFDPEGKIAGKRNPTGQWVNLGKHTTGSGSGDPSLDALIDAIIGHQARLPGGKMEAEVATRAKNTGKTLPSIATDPAKALTAANNAYKEYLTIRGQQDRAKESSKHFYNFYQGTSDQDVVDMAKFDADQKEKAARDLYEAAGIPFPGVSATGSNQATPQSDASDLGGKRVSQ